MPPRVRQITAEVCAQFQVSEGDLRGPIRRRGLNVARCVCWIAIRSLVTPTGKPFSYPQIGRWFGRDHSTIIKGVGAFVERERVASERRVA